MNEKKKKISFAKVIRKFELAEAAYRKAMQELQNAFLTHASVKQALTVRGE